MVASAGTVTVDFAAETAKFTAELKQVNTRLKELQGSFSGLESFAKGALSILSVGVVTGFAKQMFEAADAVGDMAARLGVSASELSKLKYIADQSDVEFQTLTIGLKAFQKSLSEGDKVFKELNLSAAALKKLSLSEQLATVADAFRLVKNPADQTRISTELFTKAGLDMVPMMNQGSAGMRDLGDAAERVGAVMSNQTAKAIGDTDAALKSMKSSVAGATTSLLGALSPAITGIAQALSATAPLIEKFTRAYQLLGEAVAHLQFGADSAEARIAEEGAALVKRRTELLQTISLHEQEIKKYGPSVAQVRGRFSLEGLAADKVEVEKLGVQIEAIQTQQIKNIEALRSKTAEISQVPASALFDPNELSEVKVTARADPSGIGLSGNAAEAARAQTDIEKIIHDSRERQRAEGADIALEEQSWREAQVKAVFDAADQERQARANSAKEIADAQIAEATRSAAARKAVEQSVVTSGIAALNAWNSATTKKSKELVAINKAVSMAQAIQNTYVGATKAIAQGGVWGFAQAGAIIAFGLAQVAAIARTNYGSSSTASTSGTSVSTAFTSSTSDSTTQGASSKGAVQIAFNGPIYSSAETAQWLIDTITEAVQDRDVVLFSSNSRQAQELIPA